MNKIIVNGDTIPKEEVKKLALKFNMKFKKKNNTKFNNAVSKYLKLKDFKINENVYDTNHNTNMYDKHVQYIVQIIGTYFMNKVFGALKIDMTDNNTKEDTTVGNIGTPGRIVKMFTGSTLDDDTELMSGRWIKSPRLASFKDDLTEEEFGFPLEKNIPITKRVDIVALCSHHAVPFSSMFRSDSYAVISYIPKDFVLGISKLQRITNYVSRRGWLQEDLTRELYREVALAAKTNSVYVRLYNLVHNCEFLRGAQSSDGCFTSEFYGGKFKKKKFRAMVLDK
jgi:GTP cyclohydrolase I